MSRTIDREKIVRDVCLEQGVDAELVLSLLALEDEHSNLHLWGSRPRLRRAVESIMDEALRASDQRDA